MFFDALLDDEIFEIAEIHGLSAIQVMGLFGVAIKLSYSLYGWLV